MIYSQLSAINVAFEQLTESSLTYLYLQKITRKKVYFLTSFTQIKLIDIIADNQVLGTTARLTLLNNSSQCVKAHLSKSKLNLLPAKLLIMSRLIYKLLSESDAVPAYIDTVKEQLASMRRKLLDRIDDKVSGTIHNELGLAEDLTAFSVVTSSTPADTLRYFLQIRLDTLLFSLNNSKPIHECVLQALNIFFNTLKQAKLVFRSQLTESFLKLKSRPLLQDSSIRTLQELNLDLYESWLPGEIRNYIPYIRHDELRKADIDKRLGTWAEDALRQLTERTAARLDVEKNFNVIVKLRKDVFKICLSNVKLLPSDVVSLLDIIRVTFLSRLQKLIKLKTLQLTSLCGHIRLELKKWPYHMESSNVEEWQLHSQKVSEAIEAEPIKRYIYEQTYNLDKHVLRIKHSYARWSQSIAALATSIEGMKNVRFDDYLDDISEDQDQEALIYQLRHKDPQTLQLDLSKSLSDIGKAVAERLLKLVQLDIEEKDEARSHKAAFLLRTLRELSHCQPDSSAKISSNSFMMFTTAVSAVFTQKDLSKPLQSMVAQAVIEGATESLNSIGRILKKSKRVPGRCIWDGDPPLPTQPMPQTYQFLRVLLQHMILHGYDIWSLSAIDILKQEIFPILEATFRELSTDLKTFQKEEPKDANITKTQNSQYEEQNPDAVDDMNCRDKVIQLTFEIFYLSKIFELSKLSANWKSLKSDIVKAAALEKTPAIARIDKSASDYWKRTYLYFGLLASR